MVHVGSIEEVAKQEFREARRQNSLHRGPYQDYQRRGRGEYGSYYTDSYYDKRAPWKQNRRSAGRNWSNERVQ